jgi:hypothetical protein
MIISEYFLNQASSGKYVSLNEERIRTKKATDFISAGKTKDKPLIFLSHKHDELKALEQTIKLIKSCGVDVFIDWLDDGMPKKTCLKTAEKIKRKIRDSDKFILIGTEAAINSKWCNWELGIGDVNKLDTLDIAVLPIKDNFSDYSGNEYIELYPTIQYEDGNNNYFLKEKLNDTNIDVYYLLTNNSLVQNKIPKGYYLQFQDDYEDVHFIFYVRLEDWLINKITL